MDGECRALSRFSSSLLSSDVAARSRNACTDTSLSHWHNCGKNGWIGVALIPSDRLGASLHKGAPPTDSQRRGKHNYQLYVYVEAVQL